MDMEIRSNAQPRMDQPHQDAGDEVEPTKNKNVDGTKRVVTVRESVAEKKWKAIIGLKQFYNKERFFSGTVEHNLYSQIDDYVKKCAQEIHLTTIRYCSLSIR